MDTIKLDANILGSLNYLYKHLYDSPAQNPTNVPKIGPKGNKITNIKQIASLLGVETKIAAIYALQDPEIDEDIKIQAKEALVPGIYVSADDSFEPILYQAYSIVNKPLNTQKKGVRLVRTVNGVRRFRLPRGSIIVNDGENPLDAITALPNDVPGYEKLAGKDGGIYYVGNENGKWVVRDLKSNTIIHNGQVEDEAYQWLNQYAGGSKPDASNGGAGIKPKTPSERVLGVSPSATRSAAEVDIARSDPALSKEQARVVNKLTTEQLDLYKRLKERGLTHEQALLLATLQPPTKTTAKKMK